ncbi:mitochondrial glycoprotein [Zopfochytrium polystomum]|nr:mitochondrial glycoprotein [Zopfochytrium polystomum]
MSFLLRSATVAAPAIRARTAAAVATCGIRSAGILASPASSSSLTSSPCFHPRASAPLRAFSASTASRSHSAGDRDLEQKLREELKFETEEAPEEPKEVKSYLSKGVFKVESKPGEKETTLTRTFGNEKISVIFSTDSLNEEPNFDEDESEEPKTVPINLTVVCEKKAGGVDAGALELSVTLEDGSFFIDSVNFFPTSSLASDTSAEGDWQRRGRYGGPVFGDLDEQLQDLFHQFLSERGFDEELAAFLPSFIEVKEQAEYSAWLKSVGEWVSK